MKVFTEEHRAKMRAAWTPERKAKHAASRKGKPVSEEQKRQISKTLTGRKRPYTSPEWRANLSKARLGKPSALKGIPKPDGFGAKVSASMKGKPKSPEHRAKLGGKRPKWIRDLMSAGIRNRTDEQKKLHIERFKASLTPEIREKIGATHRGKKMSDEIRAKLAEAHTRAKYPFRNSKPEVKVSEWLTRNGVEHRKHVRLEFYPLHAYDVVIDSCKCVLEVDGCYWHGCPAHYPGRSPEQTVRDGCHNGFAEQNGWGVIRIWEHEINAGDFTKLLPLTKRSAETSG